MAPRTRSRNSQLLIERMTRRGPGKSFTTEAQRDTEGGRNRRKRGRIKTQDLCIFLRPTWVSPGSISVLSVFSVVKWFGGFPEAGQDLVGVSELAFPDGDVTTKFANGAKGAGEIIHHRGTEGHRGGPKPENEGPEKNAGFLHFSPANLGFPLDLSLCSLCSLW